MKLPLKSLSLFLFIVFLSLITNPNPVVAGPDEAIAGMTETAAAFHAITQKAKAAVVYILVHKGAREGGGGEKTAGAFFNDPDLTHFLEEKSARPSRNTSDRSDTTIHGTGCLISPTGMILTNAHVVNNAEEIVVRLMDGREFTAALVGQDTQSDIALIKIEGDRLPTLSLGDSSALKVGEWALAIGSPFEMIQTVTAGIISATGRSSIGISEYEDFIQTDAAINSGNSGGPLLNISGQVIGINTAFLTRDGGYMGVGFAIPINMARTIAERLQKDGKITRSWMGAALQDVSPIMLTQLNLPENAGNGALVNAIEKNSPAAQSALQKGDLILAMNGIPVVGASDLRNRIALTAPGTTVTLRALRNGQNLSATILLKEKHRPDQNYAD